jgi:hypothetical protein
MHSEFNRRLWMIGFRRTLTALALLACAAAVPGQARLGGDFGLGFVAGIPSGVSGKYWLNNVNAVDMILGFNPYADYLEVRADYVWHEMDLIPVKVGKMPLYYGMGAGLSVGDRVPGLMARGVVGLEYLFAKAPLDVFLELGPGISVFPSTGGDLTAGIGMRFFF